MTQLRTMAPVTEQDWYAWHADYDVPATALARRLAAVQEQVRAALDAARPGPLRAISLCAGQGRDLTGALAGHPRQHDVRARLVELDPRNADAARQAARAAGLPQVEVVTGDAALTDAYAGMTPADLVLACGVFGNLTSPSAAITPVPVLFGICLYLWNGSWSAPPAPVNREPGATCLRPCPGPVRPAAGGIA